MHRKAIFSILLIFLITLLYWNHITRQSFIGDGFIYFVPVTDSNVLLSFPLTQDTFPYLIFYFLMNIFKDEIFLYMIVQLIGIGIINSFLFLMMRSIFKDNFFALFSTILLILSYIANYNMYSSGGYQYFIQRGIVLIPLSLSFIFLIKYTLENFKISHAILSYLFFFVSIVLGFFGTFFSPILIVYPILFLIINLNRWKKIFLKLFWLPFGYIFINLFLIRTDPSFNQGPSLISFLLVKSEETYFGVTQQLSAMTLPVGLTKFLFDSKASIYLGLDHKTILWILSFILIIFYLLLITIIWKRSPNLRSISFSSFIALIIILILNYYKNSENIKIYFDTSRYYTYPFIFTSILYGSLIYSIVQNYYKKYLMSILLLFIWGIYNFNLIQNNLKQDNYKHIANFKTFKILKNKYPQIKQEASYVILPSFLAAYGSDFAFKYYSHPGGNFLLENYFDKSKPIDINADHLYFIHFDPYSKRIVDLTETARKDYVH